MAFTQVTVTGVVYLSNEVPAAGATVQFLLSKQINDGETAIFPQLVSAVCGDDGSFSIVLSANNDPSTNANTPGSYYTVTIFSGGQQLTIPPLRVVVPYNSETADLFSLLAPTFAAPSVSYVSQIQASEGIIISPSGGTGLVTINVTPNTFDAYGSAATAQSNAESYAAAQAQAVKVVGYPPVSGHNSFAQGGLGTYGTDPVGVITSSSAGSFAQGYALSGTIQATRPGAFAQGYANDKGAITSGGGYNFPYGSFAQGNAGRNASIISGNLGTFAQDYAGQANGDYLCSISATYSGAFAQGYAANGGVIISSGAGTFAQGYASYGAPATLESSGSGSFAQGYAKLTIQATNIGSFAQGYAIGTIRSIGYGSFAQGSVRSSTGFITASGHGSFAQGYTSLSAGTNSITASGIGSFAHGDASGGSISATADNAAQFGPGTNAQANSLQVGNGGIRLLGSAGAQPQTTPQNGDIWVGSDNHVKIYSNGAIISI